MGKSTLILASILAGLAVAFGAFGAHGLQPVLQENGRVETFNTAVLYHIFHALGLLIVGVIGKEKRHKNLQIASYCFVAGIIVFSGSLYALSITNMTVLGAITPIGGIAFLAGWSLLAYHFVKNY